ncbi:MAG: SIR2 family protein [Bryobacteraceae bacterium]|nr:SIR2 family protein [Bryobacteraceae bacterium]
MVRHLIRQLAHLKNQPTDSPEAWYEQQFGRTPEYSALLGEVAKSPAERMQLLRGYFEPTAEEREEGRKLPTAAHRAIAKLVSGGYVRVIVTTNFDRLLEGALQDVGIQPTVISTADAAVGALPLVHSPCTIIKLNGDYLDSRLKNTGDELMQYDEPLERLLNQIFDEYGLVVCGWSAECDTALRAGLERCTTHRFTTYWAVRGTLGEKAQDLVVLRGAVVVPITGADEFFTEMLEKVAALESFAESDLLSTKVAVARMKKYLADGSQRIRLHDLLTTETERAYAAVNDHRFSMLTSDVPPSEIPARLEAYEASLDTVLNLLVCGAYWAEPEHDALLVRCYARLIRQSRTGWGLHGGRKLQRYPGLLLVYAMGLASVSSGNYRFLGALLFLKVREEEYEEAKPVAAIFHTAAVPAPAHQKQAPVSDRLFRILREPLRAYLPDDTEYDRAFDWFEYLLSLCHCDAQYTRDGLAELKKKNPEYTLEAPVGRFGWKALDEVPKIQTETQLGAGEPFAEKLAAVIKAGFFDSAGRQMDKYADVKAGFDRYLVQLRRQWNLWRLGARN